MNMIAIYDSNVSNCYQKQCPKSYIDFISEIGEGDAAKLLAALKACLDNEDDTPEQFRLPLCEFGSLFDDA